MTPENKNKLLQLLRIQFFRFCFHQTPNDFSWDTDEKAFAFDAQLCLCYISATHFYQIADFVRFQSLLFFQLFQFFSTFSPSPQHAQKSSFSTKLPVRQFVL